MVSLVLEFIQNNIMLLSLLLFIAVVLSVFVKFFRHLFVTCLGGGLVTFVFLVLYKLGYGFEYLYDVVNRFLQYTFNDLSQLQDLLIKSEGLLSFINGIKINIEINSLYFKNLDVVFEMPCIFISTFVQNVVLDFRQIVSYIKETSVKRIKLSSYNFVYRC